MSEPCQDCSPEIDAQTLGGRRLCPAHAERVQEELGLAPSVPKPPPSIEDRIARLERELAEVRESLIETRKHVRSLNLHDRGKAIR